MTMNFPETKLPPLEKLQWLTTVAKASADNGNYSIRSGLTIDDAEYILKHVLELAKEVAQAEKSRDDYKEALYILCTRVVMAHRAADPLLAAERSNEGAAKISGPLKPLTTFKNPFIRAMLEALGYRPRLPLDGRDSPEANS